MTFLPGAAATPPFGSAVSTSEAEVPGSPPPPTPSVSSLQAPQQQLSSARQQHGRTPHHVSGRTPLRRRFCASPAAAATSPPQRQAENNLATLLSPLSCSVFRILHTDEIAPTTEHTMLTASARSTMVLWFASFSAPLVARRLSCR